MTSNVVHAQTYRPHVFSAEQGLAQSQVMSILQDRRGYIWICTKGGGVSRFDGRNFKTFTTDQGLPGNEVMAIAEASDGNLWFACNRAGLCWYDGFEFHLAGTSSTPFQEATDVFCSPSGSVCMATNDAGLFIWDGKQMRNLRKADGLPSDSIYCIYPAAPGELWLGTTRGIASLKDGTIRALDPAHFAGLPMRSIGAMAHTPAGGLIGSEGPRIWRYDNHRFSFDSLETGVGGITSLAYDGTGNLWVTGANLAARITKDSLYILGAEDGLKQTATNCLLSDANGNMWLGTEGAGAIRYTPEAFTMYGQGTPFLERSVFSILEYGPDEFVVGTERGIYTLKHGLVSPLAAIENPLASSYAIFRENAGTVLLVSTVGIYRWDGKRTQQILDRNGLRSVFFLGITQNEKGEILVPTNTALMKVGPDSLEVIPTPGLTFGAESYFPFQDHQQRIWIHYMHRGLLRWENGVVKDFKAQHDLSQRSVYDFEEDEYGGLWIATDAGLLRFRDDQSCYLTTREGLSGNVVYLLQKDGAGNLWVGTESGLTRITLNPASDPMVIHTFGKVEGFTGIECNQAASTMDSQGRLWFGTVEGLSCFNPADEIKDMAPPHIEIIDFRLDQESIDWAARKTAIERWTNVPIDAVLDPDEDRVRIDYAGITQRLGERVTYRYILEGLDKEYSEVTAETYRVYSPLPPGDYTFKVLACNANGIWTKEPATIHFTIRAPFWKTGWFAIVAFLSTIAALIAIVRIRTNTLQRQRAVLELKVKQRTEALEQANQVKGEFLAKMSHEIRTPMNGVIGMTDLLERTALTQQQRKFVDNIRVSGQTLLSLINDILDFSRIESGKLELEQIPFDLRHTMEEVMDILAFSAFSKGLELLYWVDPAIRGPVIGDPARIKQILTNLVGNAIKFTPTGEIILRAKLVQLEGETAIIQCSVIDSGIGIPAEKHATLFESFTQVDASTTRKYGGTGLGLAISYNLSRMMGGDMWLDSAVGKGSEFHFTIHAGTSGPWKFLGDDHPAKALEGRQIAVAMKHAATRELLAEYLEHWGVVMHAYDTIENATDAALDLPNISFLLVDLRLSHGDPSLITKKIDAICSPRGLNYGLMAEPDVAIPLANLIGKQGWILPKPFKRDDLLHALIGRRQDSEVQLSSESLSTLAAQIPLRILIAEDNPINQDVAVGMLSSLGYVVEIAPDGQKALEKTLKGGIDLIFMDVQMPVMDGMEATRQIIAALPPDKRPIIVAMTANAMESDRQNCLNAGMQTFISKPFLMNELVRMLRTVPAMRSGKLDQPLEVPAENLYELPAAEVEMDGVTPQAELPRTRLTDMAMLDSVSGGEAGFVLGILVKLVAKLPEAVAELRKAAEAQDWETVRATAHRNKSSAAYSGSDALKEKFKELEHIARERIALEVVPLKLDELEAFVSAVVEELKEHIAERSK